MSIKPESSELMAYQAFLKEATRPTNIAFTGWAKKQTASEIVIEATEHCRDLQFEKTVSNPLVWVGEFVFEQEVTPFNVFETFEVLLSEMVHAFEMSLCYIQESNLNQPPPTHFLLRIPRTKATRYIEGLLIEQVFKATQKTLQTQEESFSFQGTLSKKYLQLLLSRK